MARVMPTNHSPAVVMRAPRSMSRAIRDTVPRGHTSLVGALAWRGELLSQTTSAMLLRAVITTARLWIITITMAMGYATLRK
jgi:hypothetical protein